MCSTTRNLTFVFSSWALLWGGGSPAISKLKLEGTAETSRITFRPVQADVTHTHTHAHTRTHTHTQRQTGRTTRTLAVWHHLYSLRLGTQHRC